MTDDPTKETRRSAPLSNISDADVLASLFAGAHGRDTTTSADRQIGERMRAHADRIGWELKPKGSRHG